MEDALVTVLSDGPLGVLAVVLYMRLRAVEKKLSEIENELGKFRRVVWFGHASPDA